MTDAFSAAFDDIMKLGDEEPSRDFGKETPATAAPIPASAEPPAPEDELEVPIPGAIAPEPPAPEDELEVPIPGAIAPEPVATPQTPALDDAAVDRLLAGLAAKVRPPERQQPQQRQQGPEPLVTAAEAEMINKYYADWEDVAKASEVVLRAALQQQKQAIYAEMAAVLRPKLDMIDALATRAQLAYFEQKVPNYDTVAEQIGPWVNSQPDYLRNAYLSVMQSGTEDQVLDLIGRYQQATGATQAAQPPAKQATELSPAAKQAAARLAPISSKRATTTAIAPSTDYDSAFEEAVKSI